MPVQLTTIETSDIIADLRRRGYGIDSCHGFAFRLAVRSQTVKRKSDGLGLFEPIGGVTVRQLRQIATTSRDVKHAADRIESLAKGITQTVEETDETRSGPSMASVLHVVDSRIDEKLEPVNDALGQLLDIVKGLSARMEQRQPELLVSGHAQQAPATPAPAVANHEEFGDFTAEELAAIPPPPPPQARKRRKKVEEPPVAEGDAVAEAAE